MKIVLLFGPQAVGKMTIGQELEKETGLKLFHNHMTLELLHPFFGFTPETFRLSALIREEMFKAMAKSGIRGIVFTYVWAFDRNEDWAFIEKVCSIFEQEGNEVYFAELEADAETRIARNKTESRLLYKPTKRNIGESEKNLLESMEQHRLNSLPGEIKRDNYIRIDNTYLEPAETAGKIIEAFALNCSASEKGET